MEALYRRFRERDFMMLAVSQDESGSTAVLPFVEQLGLSFPVLVDPDGKVSRQYGVTGYPETFVIDRKGRVIDHFIGPEEWSSEPSQRYFDDLLRRVETEPSGALARRRSAAD